MSEGDFILITHYYEDQITVDFSVSSLDGCEYTFITAGAIGCELNDDAIDTYKNLEIDNVITNPVR